MSRVPSRASSTCARHAVIIPRSERCGLPSRFTILPEIENPYDSKRATRWGITATITVATAAAPLGSSIFLPFVLLPSNPAKRVPKNMAVLSLLTK
ncbi:hypothetical protein BM221_010296 [Beauveria bassiana]|uniref:Uncharacterized protein n=1 Tax=Beauveria bassiana TaxID=176275 RepID=A0A2N6N968_BEABA|nr:hypothetical protein BM221_010296 [Beauveria bassiana]